MNPYMMQAVIQLLVFTLMVETATEYLHKIPGLRWLLSKLEKPVQALTYSVAITVIFEYGVFAKIVGIAHPDPLSIWVDYVLTGMVVARGSHFIHEKLAGALRKAQTIE